MGKRELLLFLGFLAFGAIVYQATAPPKEPNKESFSLSNFVGQMQAEIKGEQAQTSIERTTSADAPTGSGRLLIPQFRGTVTIVGEDRSDLAAELKAIVYGIDDHQAEARANDVNVTLSESGDDVKAEIALPKEIRRRPQVDLTLRVPSHLAVLLELRGGQADLRRVGKVRLENSRGKVTMADVGDVEGGFDSGNLEIVHARDTQLKVSRTQTRLEDISGELTLEQDHGEIRIQQIHGPAKLTLERLDCEIDAIHGPTRIEPDHVKLSVRNIAAPLTIKGQHTEVIATMKTAVPVTIETTDDQIDLRAPELQGVTIDARADNGQIRVADSHDAELGGTAAESNDDIEKPDQPSKPGRPETPEKPDKREHAAKPEPPRPPAPPDAPPRERGLEGRAERQRAGHNEDAHEARSQRTALKLHGGGPLITLRNERADIIIR